MLALGWLPIALWALHEYFPSLGRRWLVLFVVLAVSALVIVAVLAPVALQYYLVRVEQHQIRSVGEIEGGGADVRAYFVAASGLWARWLPMPKAIVSEEKELFPGLVGPLLAAFAIWRMRADAKSGRQPITGWALAYGVITAAGVLLSLGPLVRVWGVELTHHGPYD